MRGPPKDARSVRQRKRAGGRLIQRKDQLCKRRLAGAVLADDRQFFAGANVERYAGQRFRFIVVREMDVVQPYLHRLHVPILLPTVRLTVLFKRGVIDERLAETTDREKLSSQSDSSIAQRSTRVDDGDDHCGSVAPK